MLNRRSLISLTVLAVLLALSLNGQAAEAAAPAPEEESSQDALYRSHAERYFYQRSLEFELEMTRLESFLVWLYQGIVAEVSRRQKENPQGALEALSPRELTLIEESIYTPPPDIEEAPLRIRYQAWEKLHFDEFRRKYAQARTFKDRLIKSATANQRQRMFQWDLRSAIFDFRDGYYDDVVLKFNELIDHYGYDDIADVVFYRGESFFVAQLTAQAESDYLFVLEHSDDLVFRQEAAKRLLAIAGAAGDLAAVRDMWSRYESEASPEVDEDYWPTGYMTARYFMSMQEWLEARQLFDQTPTSSERFAQARLLAGDCSLALLEIDDASSRYLDIAAKRIKGKGFSKEIRREAFLKLGYIDFLRGDFELSIARFNQVKGSDDLAERAAITIGWALFRLHSYNNVVEHCREFIDRYPQTQYLYEAHCLIGYCEELLGRSEGSIGSYNEVMSAVDSRQDFHDLNYERKAITESVSELWRIEPLLFLQGEKEMFDRYMELRSRLLALINGVNLAVCIKSNPVVEDLVNEQRELYRLFQEQTAIEEQVSASSDPGIADDYDGLYGEVMELASELNVALRYYMQQKSLIQREEEQQFTVRQCDSLRVKFDREWIGSDEALGSVRGLKLEAARSGDSEAMVDLSGVELALIDVQNQILRRRGRLEEIGIEGVVSNLEHWSWFAYQRHATEGLNFDHLYTRLDRLQELDNYIQQINNVLTERRSTEEVVAELPEEMVPVVEPGAAPYTAPPIPMWQPEVPPPEEIPPKEVPPEIEDGALKGEAEPVIPEEGGETLQPEPEEPTETPSVGAQGIAPDIKEEPPGPAAEEVIEPERPEPTPESPASEEETPSEEKPPVPPAEEPTQLPEEGVPPVQEEEPTQPDDDTRSGDQPDEPIEP